MPKHFTSGETVPASGIYSVQHAEHRLPHEVTLLEGQHFPACAKCGTAVTFTALRPVGGVSDRRERILLYSLPEVQGGSQDYPAMEDGPAPTSKPKHKPRAKAHRKGKL